MIFPQWVSCLNRDIHSLSNYRRLSAPPSWLSIVMKGQPIGGHLWYGAHNWAAPVELLPFSFSIKQDGDENRGEKAKDGHRLVLSPDNRIHSEYEKNEITQVRIKSWGPKTTDLIFPSFFLSSFRLPFPITENMLWGSMWTRFFSFTFGKRVFPKRFLSFLVWLHKQVKKKTFCFYLILGM